MSLPPLPITYQVSSLPVQNDTDIKQILRYLDTNITSIVRYLQRIKDSFIEETANAVIVSPNAGIRSLDSLVIAEQFLDRVDDTNVKLAIQSAGNTHTFTLSWAGELAHSRQASDTVYTSTLSGITLNLTGTPNRISVSGSTTESAGGSVGTIDIEAAYVGQASITTLGTVSTGNWKAGSGTGIIVPAGTINVQTSATGIGNGADTTDDTLFTYNLPLNSLSTNGLSIRAMASGHYATNVNSKRTKFWFAGTVIADSGVITLSNVDWKVEVEIIRIDATHVSCTGRYTSSMVVSTVTVTPNLVVSDLTSNASIVKITGASTITGAANDVLGYAVKATFEN